MFELLRPTANGITYILRNTLLIEVSTRCNLCCSICNHTLKEESIDMSLETFWEIISKIRGQQSIKTISLFWRGEPTLNPHLPQMVEMCKEEGYKTLVSTNTATTNLHNIKYVQRLLTSLDDLYLSLDGYNQESLQRYRVGANWDTVMRNFEVISKIQTPCNKTLKVLMFRYNETKKPFFKRVAKRYGIPNIRFAPPVIHGKTVLTQKEADTWLPKNPKYLRYTKQGEVWVHRSPKTCGNPPAITVMGDVHVCCDDWELKYPLGNILKNSMKEIGSNFTKIIQQKTERQLSICKENCFSLLECKNTR